MAETKTIATRLAFGQELARIGAREDIMAMDADLSCSTMTSLFRDQYPERHINCGIAEGNMMATAAGLASCGKRCLPQALPCLLPDARTSRFGIRLGIRS